MSVGLRSVDAQPEMGAVGNSSEFSGRKVYWNSGFGMDRVPVGAVTWTSSAELTLAGRAEPSPSSSAAQSQYGIRNVAAACPYRSRSVPLNSLAICWTRL